MEAAATHCSGVWSYRENIGSSSYTTSRSGTTLSSTYASTRASGLSCDLLEELPLSEEDRRSEEENRKVVGLVEEFCAGDGSNSVSAIERWLWELDVGWLLHLNNDASAAGSLRQDQHAAFASRWIRALHEISGSIRYMSDSSRLPKSVVVEKSSEEQTMPKPVQIALFAQAAILKMLHFVDTIVAPILFFNGTIVVAVPAPPETLEALIHVRKALQTASQEIVVLQLFGTPHAEDTRILVQIDSITKAKLGMLDEAVWNTIEDIMIRLLAPTADASEWGAENQQGSADIHKLNRSVTGYIKVLFSDIWVLDLIVRQASNKGILRPEPAVPIFAQQYALHLATNSWNLAFGIP